MAKSNEPIGWSLFSAGGMATAFFIPITIVLTSIVVPAGWIGAESLPDLLVLPLARVYLFVLISLCLVHCAHCYRSVLVVLCC